MWVVDSAPGQGDSLCKGQAGVSLACLGGSKGGRILVKFTVRRGAPNETELVMEAPLGMLWKPCEEFPKVLLQVFWELDCGQKVKAGRDVAIRGLALGSHGQVVGWGSVIG